MNRFAIGACVQISAFLLFGFSQTKASAQVNYSSVSLSSVSINRGWTALELDVSGTGAQWSGSPTGDISSEVLSQTSPDPSGKNGYETFTGTIAYTVQNTQGEDGNAYGSATLGSGGYADNGSSASTIDFMTGEATGYADADATPAKYEFTDSKAASASTVFTHAGDTYVFNGTTGGDSDPDPDGP